MQLDFFKVVTILYALVGIPLMFIYMANIGTILATSFKYTYSKMCRWPHSPACEYLSSKVRGRRGRTSKESNFALNSSTSERGVRLFFWRNYHKVSFCLFSHIYSGLIEFWKVLIVGTSNLLESNMYSTFYLSSITFEHGQAITY